MSRGGLNPRHRDRDSGWGRLIEPSRPNRWARSPFITCAAAQFRRTRDVSPIRFWSGGTYRANGQLKHQMSRRASMCRADSDLAGSAVHCGPLFEPALGWRRAHGLCQWIAVIAVLACSAAVRYPFTQIADSGTSIDRLGFEPMGLSRPLKNNLEPTCLCYFKSGKNR